jgi:hypothetical protein
MPKRASPKPAAAGFGLALFGISATESLLGRPVSGGDGGTSVGRVFGTESDPTGEKDPAPEPSVSPTDLPSATESAGDAEPTDEPTGDPAPTAEPTGQATEDPGTDPTSEPTEAPQQQLDGAEAPGAATP